MIDLNRDHAADSIAIVRLMRTGKTNDALFILSSYADDVDGLHALVGSLAAFTTHLLNVVDSMSAELNTQPDTVVPDGNAILASAAAAVVNYDPSNDDHA
jgi:hypothetical protein